MPSESPSPFSIVVADDEKPILHVLQIGLENHGYTVYAARSANEALAIVRKEAVDCALLDIRLPDQNGIDLGVAIRQLCPKVIIILMTGFPGIRSAVEALRNHVSDYLIKPFRVDQVVAAIERAREDHRLHSEHERQAEMIQALRTENAELKQRLLELMPHETRIRRKSLHKYGRLRSDWEVALNLYARQQGRDVPAKAKNPDEEYGEKH
jgi:DNA-binding NtrC family response regulator